MASDLQGFYESYNISSDHTLKKFFARKKQELQCAKSFITEVFPILKWITSYNLGWLKNDVIAGITVAILLVPQSLAYAQLAGLPPEWGLYASITPIFIYTIFATSTQVSIGPVATTAIMTSSCIEQVIKDYAQFGGENGENPTESDVYEHKYEVIAMAVSFNTGLILLVFGLFKAGKFITIFLSKPIMTGFITAAALIILIEQMKGLFGMDVGRYHLFEQTLVAEMQHLYTIHGLTTIVSLTSLSILFIPKLKTCFKCVKKIPKWVTIPIPLIVILINIMLSYFLDFESKGVVVVGNDVKQGFPKPHMIRWKYFADTFFGAFIIAIVSYMGSLALATQFEQQTQNNYKVALQEYYNGTSELENIQSARPEELAEQVEEHLSTALLPNSTRGGPNDAKPVKKPMRLPNIRLSANGEFIAYGMANLVGSFFGAQAVSASFSRSALNFEMNAMTSMSQVIQAIICILCLMVAMPALSPLPKCILSAVVTVSVYRLIGNGVREFKFLWYVSKIELFEFCVALFAPLFVGLEIGIFVAIGSSIFVNFILRNSSVFVKIHKLIKVEENDNEVYLDENFMKFIEIKKNKKSMNNIDAMSDDEDFDDGMIDGDRNVNRNNIRNLNSKYNDDSMSRSRFGAAFSRKRTHKMSYNDKDLMIDGLSGRSSNHRVYNANHGLLYGGISNADEMLLNDVVNNNNNNNHNNHRDDDRERGDDIMIIELNAQLAYINSKRMIDTLENLISDPTKEFSNIQYIIVSLAMTAFIDTTTLRQISALFQDLLVADKYIGFSNCSLSVINSVKKFEAKTKCSFSDNNIKLFVSTVDAVQYFQSKNYDRV